MDWDLDAEKRSVPRFNEPLAVDFVAVAADGDRTVSATSLPTEVITVRSKQAARAKDYRIEQYNLVLFDVGKATITGAHRRTTELVRSRLKPGSTVTIEGYTDRTGDADANRRLARDRAQSTATALSRNDATVVGIGEDRLLYANNHPEGRFYCRTVRIIVKTPVER